MCARIAGPATMAAMLVAGLLHHGAWAQPVAGDTQVRLSGPYTHQNLTIYLIHGTDVLPDADYLTLAEAMERKLVDVHETGDVGELEIENRGDRPVFIQYGEIVKGGRQDRTIACDFVVPPRSGKVAIGAFCVESGRWQQRGDESAESFSAAPGAVVGRRLKLAARHEADQSAVWREVAENQAKLGATAGEAVQSTTSPSSLMLSLESRAVQESADPYVRALSEALVGHDDVVGLAVAINGQLSSADVYGSHRLFARLWPRLLRSAAIEALAERGEAVIAQAATEDDVRAFLADAHRGRAQAESQRGQSLHHTTRQTDSSVMFEAAPAAASDAPQGAAAGGYVHRNYLRR